MAENIVINNSTSSGGGGLLSGLLNPRTILIGLVVSVISLVIAFYVFSYLWQNILGPIFNESIAEITTFFTTGFIGWLNPFDEPDGDDGGFIGFKAQEYQNKAATVARGTSALGLALRTLVPRFLRR